MSEDVSAFLASKKEEDPAEEVENPEEEVKGDWKAVDLPEVEVVTGEENTDLIFKTRGKLYRWAEEQWKERGTGDVKLIRNKETKRVSLVMRQDNTKKVVANFILEEEPLCNLVPHAGSDKAWLWIAHDFSEGERQRTKFAMRLGSPEKSQEFKKAFDDARHFNHCVRSGLECAEAPVIVEEATN
mmetsp:Transcript_24926/g.24608  ORF Transcript_24926/g.24608 Transcript_24926/m.24608 type:complete len:185 (-) Transcript_24926:24-578(-)